MAKIVRGPEGPGLQAGDRYIALSIFTKNFELKISNSLVRSFCVTGLLAAGVGASAVPALAHAAQAFDWALRLATLH